MTRVGFGVIGAGVIGRIHARNIAQHREAKLHWLVDVDPARGAAMASYLLFEADYTNELIALGRDDALSQRGQVIEFFGWR